MADYTGQQFAGGDPEVGLVEMTFDRQEGDLLYFKSPTGREVFMLEDEWKDLLWAKENDFSIDHYRDINDPRRTMFDLPRCKQLVDGVECGQLSCYTMHMIDFGGHDFKEVADGSG